MARGSSHAASCAGRYCVGSGTRCLHGPGWDGATLAYSLAQGVAYEAYDVMSGCPFGDPRLNEIASSHAMSAAQVCLRWVLQKGAIIATGTGHNMSKIGPHSEDDFGVFAPSFELTGGEMAYLDGISPH